VFLVYWLIAILPLEHHRVWRYEIVGALDVVKLAGLLCFLAAVIRIAAGGSIPSFFGSAPSWWCAAYLLLLSSSLLLHGQTLSKPLESSSHILAISCLFVAALTFVNSGRRLRRSLLVAIGALGFASLYVIREWQKYHDLYAGFRPTGRFYDGNEYALVAGLWMPLAFLWASGKRPWWEKLFCLGCLASCVLGTTLAASRGGFLGLMASFLFLIWHSRRRARNLALVGVLLLPLSLIGKHSVVDRLLHPAYADQLAREARLVAWGAGWKMIKAHPLIGVGLGNFKTMMPAYRESEVNWASIGHNTYVEGAAELGIPGLIVFLGIWVSSFRMLGRLRRRAQSARSRSLLVIALGLQAGMVSYLVSACFVSAWWYKMWWLLLFLALCLDRLAKPALAPRIEVSTAGRHRARYTDFEAEEGEAPPACFGSLASKTRDMSQRVQASNGNR
jgi:O-antigen ligase